MHEALIVKSLQEFGGLIRRVVIDYDDIELKTRLLCEGALNGVADGLFAIEDGNHHRGLELELLFVEIRTTIERRVYLGANLL